MAKRKYNGVRVCMPCDCSTKDEVCRRCRRQTITVEEYFLAKHNTKEANDGTKQND